jgi:hypothetical protein
VPEIGFGHEIPKLNVVSHLKISLENLRKKSYDQTYHKKMEKSGKTLISCFYGKKSSILEFYHFLVVKYFI